MKKLPILGFAFFCLALAACLTLYLGSMYRDYRPASYTATPGSETADAPDNPFRGFYHMYGFTLSEDPPEDMASRARQYLESGSLPLNLLQINLRGYSDFDLSDNALDQLDQILTVFSGERRQLILRFLYDWNGHALDTEPDEINRILRHMDQLAPVINAHAPAILLIQGTFMGNCGEMTQTHFGSHEDNRLLITHLAQVIDPSVFLAVRTPSQLRGVLLTRDTVSLEHAFSGSLNARLGLFNDGLCGSVYDLGTYDDTPNADTTAPEDKGTRREEIDYQNRLCRFVPNGGEAVLDNPYNDFPAVTADLAAMHISYLNRDHDEAVLKKWETSLWREDDCFFGMSGYDYIGAHLGYRYVQRDSALTRDPFAPEDSALTFSVENTGFAPAYRRFDAVVTLTRTDTGETLTYPLSMDNRLLGGGESASYTLPLNLNALTAGSYRVLLRLTDPYTGQDISFVSDNARGKTVSLGTLTVEEKNPKEFLVDLLAHLRS